MLRDLVPREEVLPLMGWIPEVYRVGAKPGLWLGKFINSIGAEEFKRRGESSGAENS